MHIPDDMARHEYICTFLVDDFKAGIVLLRIRFNQFIKGCLSGWISWCFLKTQWVCMHVGHLTHGADMSGRYPQTQQSSGWLDSYLDREHLGLFGLNDGEKQGLTIRDWREDEFSLSGLGTWSSDRVNACQERAGTELGRVDRAGWEGRPAMSQRSQPVMPALATFLRFRVHIRDQTLSYRIKVVSVCIPPASLNIF